MLPLVTNGKTDASTTRRPSSPCTRIVVGSTTASASVPIFAVHDGWSAVSASRRTQSRISSSVSTPGPGRDLAVVERGEPGLAEDVAGDPDGLDPLPAVVGRRQVVEQHRRDARSGRSSGSSRGRGCRRTSGRCAPGSRAPRTARCRRSGRRPGGSGTSGSGSRRRRCCGRSRRPRSGWSRPARGGGTATRSRSWAGPASADRVRSRPAASTRAGRRPRGGPGGSGRPRARRRRRRCRADARSSALPTPDSWRSCGLLIAPPHSSTSPAST